MKNFDLSGLRVLNTRPLPQANELNVLIQEANGCALSCPAFDLTTASLSWFDLLPPLKTVDQAIFTSANAVIYTLSYLKKKNLSWPETIRVSAIGKATGLKLNDYGIKVHNIPEKFDSEHLLKLESFSNVRNQTILLFKGEGGRQLIENTLNAREARLIILAVYKRQLPNLNQTVLSQWWQERAVDIILFTSQQTMENIFHLFGSEAKSWLLETPCLVISQRLADIASALGMQKIIIGSTDSIIETLEQFKQGQAHDK